VSIVIRDLVLPLAHHQLEVSVEMRARTTALYGPSGAGKTSLLEAIAGLRTPAAGRIELMERTVFDANRVLVPPRERRVGYVPQDDALFPHLSVRGNIFYGAPEDADATRRWFADYLEWLTTDRYGTDERDTTNNHATCWVMQVAAFAKYTHNRALMQDCRTRYKTVLLQQMAPDGSFPRELARTKPYGYSLFNLEAMATICQILSIPEDDLWTFELPDGRGMRKAMAYMAPYIRDKKTWPKPPDVMYDAHWPMRQSSLLFAGVALKQPEYLELWSRLPADSDVEEVVRNFFIRQPLLWFE